MNNYPEKAYYIKKLYADAGRRLLQDNYEYYYNTVNMNKAVSVRQRLICMAPGGLCAVLADNAGCCENIIMEKIHAAFSDNDTVFLYEDDCIENKIMAVFAYNSRFFVFSGRYGVHRRLFSVNLNSCYSIKNRRKYSPEQYVTMAGHYFEKSEYIDKDLSL